MAKKLELNTFVRTALERVREQQDVEDGEPMQMDQGAVIAAIRYAIVAKLALTDAQAATLKSFIEDCPPGFIGNASQFRQSCNTLDEDDDLWQPKLTPKASSYE